MAEVKETNNPATSGQTGGFQYRQESFWSEPNLDSWLAARDQLIELRDQKGMKRATIIAEGERVTLPIDEVIVIYEGLINNAGAGRLIE